MIRISEEKRVGKVPESDIKLTDKKFFDNKIVPMWVPTKVAASLLGISPNALRIRKCRGQIDSKYFGRELRFNVSYLSSLFTEEKSF